MSFAEFEQLPDRPGKQELVNGELITMPPPENRHSVVSKRIFRMLLNSLPEERVWGDHTGYRVGSGWIEPDASVSWPDQPQDDKYLVRAPMIAASTARLSHARRARLATIRVSPATQLRAT